MSESSESGSGASTAGSPRWVAARGAALAAAVRRRQASLVAALEAGGPAGLAATTSLPEWDRLTLLCHLRYGADATLRLTDAALAGEPAAFYPGGRDAVRPGTLTPRPGERPEQVLASLGDAFGRLDRRWAELSEEHWLTPVVEPADQPDLGSIDVAWLALLRLTEVEVHGRDLRLGLDRWSDVFVDTALPARLCWLARRRSNHRRVDDAIEGRWRFEPDGREAITVESTAGRVSVTVDASRSDVGGRRPAPTADGLPTAVLAGPAPTVLAYLLGRSPVDALDLAGDHDLARRFPDAFPPP